MAAALSRARAGARQRIALGSLALALAAGLIGGAAPSAEAHESDYCGHGRDGIWWKTEWIHSHNNRRDHYHHYLHYTTTTVAHEEHRLCGTYTCNGVSCATFGIMSDDSEHSEPAIPDAGVVDELTQTLAGLTCVQIAAAQAQFPDLIPDLEMCNQ